MNLVKFSCGCIGTEPIGKRSLVIHSCDHEGESIGFCYRDMDKSFFSLTEEDAGRYVIEIRSLIQDGYKFRIIKNYFR